MSNTIKSTIFKLLEESPEHTVFFLGDFAEYGSIETVRKIFLQARGQGLLVHLSHGIYIKPMFSRFGKVPPPLETIAKAIAERDHVEIMPAGSMAANILGLSTQVPMVASYLTTGSSRTINIGKRAIKFKHAAPRNFAYKGQTIPLIVQALKEIGEDNINENTLSDLSKYLLKTEDKDTLNEDILLAPGWIQAIVKPLIKQNHEALATIQ
ncbi:MAG: DUF6088 family protein [Bacteroidota bacterium]|jgi:hypothetical protein|nr:DUF6088 family protein [Bacteroidota bacterium]